MTEAALLMRLKVKKLTETAYMPIKGSPFAAGYDLHASEADVVPARG